MRLSSTRVVVFGSGLVILALGLAGMRVLAGPAAFGFLNGALTLGGGFIICGLFSLRNPWHGIIGAGVIALLGACRGVGNLAALPAVLTEHGGVPPMNLLECAVALICILLLAVIVRTLFAERKRRLFDRENGS